MILSNIIASASSVVKNDNSYVKPIYDYEDTKEKLFGNLIHFRMY